MAKKPKADEVKGVTVADAGLSAAQNLHIVQEEIARLKELEEQFKAQLLSSLKMQAVKSIKLDNGDQYIRMERQTLKIKDEEKAWAWAQDKNVMKIDTGKALEVVRRQLKMPSFFKLETTEYLTVKRAKQ